MKRQPYFPKKVAARPEWFSTFAAEITPANTTLGFAPAEVTSIVADALFCAYASGVWLQAVREFGPSATASLDQLYYGPTGSFALSAFTAPELPEDVALVSSGALSRIFAFVKRVKSNKNYTTAMGLTLGIVGPEDSAEHLFPDVKLKLERSGTVQGVRIRFKKFNHDGVAIYSRRNGGAWEQLAIALGTSYRDERPLLVATAAETREYRLQFYDGSAAHGDFSPVQSVNVGP